jgi:hypothetical protein
MNDRKKAELAMLLGVHEFGQRNPLVPANALATLQYTAVATAKDTMLETGAVKDQAEGEFRAAVADRHTVIKGLRSQMREIAVTAKALDRTGAKPGLALQFRMPGKTMQDLRDRAEAFQNAAEPIAQSFIDYDAAPTFIADLEAAIAAFDAVTGRRYAGRGKQVGATASLTAVARAGIIAVRALDASLIKRYRNNPALLAEWKATQRIARWPSQATAPATPPPPPSGGGEQPAGS